MQSCYSSTMYTPHTMLYLKTDKVPTRKQVVHLATCFYLHHANHNQCTQCTTINTHNHTTPTHTHTHTTDYRFLEHATVLHDTARRTRGPGPPRDEHSRPQQLPKHLHLLQRSAHGRGVRLLFMHPGGGGFGGLGVASGGLYVVH